MQFGVRQFERGSASNFVCIAAGFNPIRRFARTNGHELAERCTKWVLTRLLRIANRRSDLLSVQMHASVVLPSFATLATPVQHPPTHMRVTGCYRQTTRTGSASRRLARAADDSASADKPASAGDLRGRDGAKKPIQPSSRMAPVTRLFEKELAAARAGDEEVMRVRHEAVGRLMK